MLLQKCPALKVPRCFQLNRSRSLNYIIFDCATILFPRDTNERGLFFNVLTTVEGELKKSFAPVGSSVILTINYYSQEMDLHPKIFLRR